MYDVTHFFISNTFLQLSLSVVLLFHELGYQSVAYVLLNSYKHHHTETLVICIRV